MYSSYGKQVALEIAGDLAEAGLTIVSGLAPGIDTFSHQTVLERGKRTIAILETGLDEKSIYPQSNLKLAEKILDIDKIIEKTKLSAAVTASTLAILEIKGKIRNLGGNTYALSC